MSLPDAMWRLAGFTGGLAALAVLAALAFVWTVLWCVEQPAFWWMRQGHRELRARRDAGMWWRHPERFTADLPDGDDEVLAELARREDLDEITDAVFADLRGGAL
jgi:hypothetical protein